MAWDGTGRVGCVGVLEGARRAVLSSNLAFLASADNCLLLQADNHVVHSPELEKGGSTATVAFLHSLDLPYSLPFYASSLLSLTIAHLGDTSALLCSTHSGRVRRFTEAHHADSRTESERLRTSGTGIITDSFGESRWGGVVANTRAIGDREFKPVGVIGEPEIVKRVIKGALTSFLLPSLLSDFADPERGRRRIRLLDPLFRWDHRHPLGPRDRRPHAGDPGPNEGGEQDRLVR